MNRITRILVVAVAMAAHPGGPELTAAVLTRGTKPIAVFKVPNLTVHSLEWSWDGKALLASGVIPGEGTGSNYLNLMDGTVQVLWPEARERFTPMFAEKGGEIFFVRKFEDGANDMAWDSLRITKAGLKPESTRTLIGEKAGFVIRNNLFGGISLSTNGMEWKAIPGDQTVGMHPIGPRSYERRWKVLASSFSKEKFSAAGKQADGLYEVSLVANPGWLIRFDGRRLVGITRSTIRKDGKDLHRLFHGEFGIYPGARWIIYSQVSDDGHRFTSAEIVVESMRKGDSSRIKTPEGQVPRVFAVSDDGSKVAWYDYEGEKVYVYGLKIKP